MVWTSFDKGVSTMPKNPYSHITALLQPLSNGVDRKVWSISLAQVWTPFFPATNTSGQTAIDADAIGAPLRLQKDKDGTVDRQR